MYGRDISWYKGMPGHIWQQSICWTFIFISGFCLNLGRHPIRRGIEISFFGAIITFFTVRYMPNLQIWFGILTLIGTCMILVGLLNKALINLPALPMMVVFFGLFYFTKNFLSGICGYNYITAFFGFPFDGFYSTDYFPIIPWMFLFLMGYYFYKIYNKYRKGNKKTRPIPIIDTIGRNSLFIYILHQPIIYVILYVINIFL